LALSSDVLYLWQKFGHNTVPKITKGIAKPEKNAQETQNYRGEMIDKHLMDMNSDFH